jgi:predicted nucleic-acid-binding protein
MLVVVLEAAVQVALLRVVPHILVKVIMEEHTVAEEAAQAVVVQVASVKLYIAMVVLVVLVVLIQ